MIEALQPVARRSLTDGIVEQITALIASSVLKPGDRIPSEKQLCRQFRVGRTSVREALRSLCVMGVLESHAGEGTFVSLSPARHLERALQWGLLLDRKVVEDLVETRLMLESQTAYLAARKATKEDLRHIEQATRGMEGSLEDRERYLESDLRFHLGIARATQNSILHTLLTTIGGYLQAYIGETLASSPASDSTRRAAVSLAEHKKILRALKKGHSEEARRAMTEHILSSREDLSKHLSSRTHAQDGNVVSLLRRPEGARGRDFRVHLSPRPRAG